MSELLAFEWRRAKSIRTTWITSIFTILGVGFFAFIATVAVSAETGDPLDLPLSNTLETAVINNPIVLVLLSSLAAMAFGHEYRYGTIRLTLTAFPRRAGVFFVKLCVTLLLVFLVTALGAGLAYAIMAGSGKTSPGDLAWSSLAWHLVVFATTFAVLAFSFTVIARSHPLGIVGPLLLFMLELILLPLIASRYEWVPKLFPITAMTNWFSAGSDALLGAGVWAAWMVGLLLLSFVLLMRRDA